MADRLIVALDVPTIEGAAHLAARLDGIVSFFKIGLWLLFAPGAERFIDGLIGHGEASLPRCQDVRHRRDRAAGRRTRRRARREPGHRAWRSGDHARRGGRQGAVGAHQGVRDQRD